MDPLLSVYLGCLILGGGLVLFSIVLGDADADADADVDVDMDVDMDVDADVDVDAGVAPGVAHGVGGHDVGMGDALWLPLLSMRFWTFFLAFFGLTGTLLYGLSLNGAIASLVLSGGVGFCSGYAAAKLINALKRDQVSSAIEPEKDYQGKAGQVILAVEPGKPGVVRLNIKGSSVDLDAVAADGSSVLARNSQVIVVSYADETLTVAAFDTGESTAAAERTPEREPA